MPKAIRTPKLRKKRGRPYSKKPVKVTSVAQGQDVEITQNSTFLSLPAEVRVRIYECLVDLQDEGGKDAKFIIRKKFERAYITLRPLLRVCRLVNQEWTPFSCYGAHLAVNCSQLSRQPAALVEGKVHFGLAEYNNRFLRDPAQPKLSYIRKLTYDLTLPKSGSTDFGSLNRLARLLLKKPTMLKSLIQLKAYTQTIQNGQYSKWDAVIDVFSDILNDEWHSTNWRTAEGRPLLKKVGVTFSRVMRAIKSE
ncbi:hypothetical protein H2200_001707 [Cladophialophora chaetospira]|uniref:Uncharacterized protein n=1 Tax=Cladophialophora chaetospira TaxID=386627 RepID=A0AA38XLE3_9EURO|nr:hypothetical protein H2200_001707 [Cladophialophora chaetospira]